MRRLDSLEYMKMKGHATHEYENIRPFLDDYNSNLNIESLKDQKYSSNSAKVWERVFIESYNFGMNRFLLLPSFSCA